MKTIKRKRLAAFLLLLVLASVGSTLTLAEEGLSRQSFFAPAVYNTTPCNITVVEGQSIQTAIGNAKSGDVVCVGAGTYHEQIQLRPAHAGVTVMALPGERPVLDGRGVLPATSGSNQYLGLIHITGSNVTVDGLDVVNSAMRGVVVAQPTQATQPIQNVVVRNLVVRDSYDAGININGNTSYRARNILIENNVVANNLRKNRDGGAGGSGLTFIEAENSIARGNTVFNNLGEGLVAGRWTSNLIFEDNIAYDNRSANLYLINTVNPLVQRNFIFCTDDRLYWRGTTSELRAGPGLQIRDEDFPGQTVKPPPSSGQIIVNNIVVGCGSNFGVGSQVAGGGLNNALVANNSFINARGDSAFGVNNVEFEGRASYQNTRFVNNLILQSIPGTIVRIQLNSGTPDLTSFSLANNLYSVDPGSGWPGGEPGRLIADPLLANPVLPAKGNPPNPAGYGIRSNSPAINAGAAVSQVVDDFFRQPRNGAPDIGADEAGSTAPATGQIIVMKETTPERATQVFDFTISYPPGSIQLRDGESHNSGDLAEGTYSVTAEPVDGWTTTGTCSDGSSPDSIALAAGETVTCTFRSEEQPQPAARLIVQKVTVPAGDPQAFQFSSNFAGDFQLAHGQEKSADLAAGTYAVAETVPDGWTQAGATCSDGSSPAAIDLAPGETVTCTFTNQKQGGGGEQAASIYITTPTAGTVGGVSYDPGDILAFNSDTGVWSLYFDGSDVGLTKAISDFEILPDGSLIMAVSSRVKLKGASGTFTLYVQDIARFVPSSLGTTTAGVFELYFDGSDVALSTSGEKIDALARKADGTLLISTVDVATVKNGGTTLRAQDEDLLAFKPQTLGANTKGTWSLGFVGSALTGMAVEDVTSAWYDDNSGDLYLTTVNNFKINGLAGTNRTVLAVTPGRAVSIYWNAANSGLATGIDSLFIAR